MKSKYILIALLLTLVLPLSAQKTITILHTNDTHSCIYPLSKNLADTLTAGRGGFLRRINMIQEERHKDPNLLLFDSGDFSQGSPYYTLFKGDVEAGLMNRMGYDAGTIGNHEFDFGLDNMERVFKELNFPIVCSNYDFGNHPLSNIVKRSIVIKRNGIRIGIIGLSPQMKGLVDENKCQGVIYEDPITVAQKLVDELRNKQKCDLVICISHLGWEGMGMDDQKLIAHTRGIDLVLGGHSHTYFKSLRYVKNLDGKSIPVDQNGKNGIFVGKIKVEMRKK